MSDIAEHARVLLNGYVDEEDLAQEFGVTKQTVRRWRRQMRGPPWGLTPGGVRYPIAEGREWLRDNLITSQRARG
jgi:transposase-like protein